MGFYLHLPLTYQSVGSGLASRSFKWLRIKVCDLALKVFKMWHFKKRKNLNMGYFSTLFSYLNFLLLPKNNPFYSPVYSL
jgi:hypothetical protein